MRGGDCAYKAHRNPFFVKCPPIETLIPIYTEALWKGLGMRRNDPKNGILIYGQALMVIVNRFGSFVWQICSKIERFD